MPGSTKHGARRAFLAVKFHADHQNKLLIEAISDLLQDTGWHTTIIVRDFEDWGAIQFTPHELMQHSFKSIQQSDVVIIEASEKGVGVGVEAGYAHAYHIPLIVIAQTGTQISTSLLGIADSVHFYDQVQDLYTVFSSLNHQR